MPVTGFFALHVFTHFHPKQSKNCATFRAKHFLLWSHWALGMHCWHGQDMCQRQCGCNSVSQHIRNLWRWAPSGQTATRNVQPIQQREIESPSKTISHLGPRLANLNRLPLHWQQQHLPTGRPLQMLLLLSNKLNSSVKTWDRKKAWLLLNWPNLNPRLSAAPPPPAPSAPGHVSEAASPKSGGSCGIQASCSSSAPPHQKHKWEIAAAHCF